MSLHAFLYMFIASVVALFPVMNPIGNGLVVNGFFGGLDLAQRKAATKRIVINCLVVGVGSLVMGHLILLLFGLAVPVIQVAGGIIICKTGLEWLSNSPVASGVDKNPNVAHKVNLENVETKLFYPISFPICLGPGSISVIFTLMATASVQDDWLHTGLNYAVICLAIFALLVVLYFVLIHAPKVTKKLGESGNLIINKLMAFITFCIGIQIVVTGLSKIFHLQIL